MWWLLQEGCTVVEGRFEVELVLLPGGVFLAGAFFLVRSPRSYRLILRERRDRSRSSEKHGPLVLHNREFLGQEVHVIFVCFSKEPVQIAIFIFEERLWVSFFKHFTRIEKNNFLTFKYFFSKFEYTMIISLMDNYY